MAKQVGFDQFRASRLEAVIRKSIDDSSSSCINNYVKAIAFRAQASANYSHPAWIIAKLAMGKKDGKGRQTPL